MIHVDELEIGWFSDSFRTWAIGTHLNPASNPIEYLCEDTIEIVKNRYHPMPETFKFLTSKGTKLSSFARFWKAAYYPEILPDVPH